MLPTGRKELGVGGPQLERKRPCPKPMPSGEGVWPGAGSQPLSGQMFLLGGSHGPQLVNTFTTSSEALSLLLSQRLKWPFQEKEGRHIFFPPCTKEEDLMATGLFIPSLFHSITCPYAYLKILLDTDYLSGLEQGPGEPWESMEKLFEKDHLLPSNCRSPFTRPVRRAGKSQGPKGKLWSKSGLYTYKLCAQG